jgi:hypothetical protein
MDSAHSCSLQGVFLRQPGGASVLTQLGHLFDETPAQLRSACERAAAAQAAAAPEQPDSSPAAKAAATAAVDSAKGDLPPQQEAAVAGRVAPDSSSNGQTGAATEQPAAAELRPKSELNVVREGSMELDYGSDDGEAHQNLPGPASCA